MTLNSTHFRFISWMFCFALLCLLATGCSSQRTIVNALDEKEANEILVFLNSRNIDASKVLNTSAGGAGGANKAILWDISVPDDRATEAMALLNANGLPRRRSQSLLGIFSGQGLVPSEMEQKIRYQAGLAEQISSVIRRIDGVLDAEVQLSFPEEDPLNPNAVKGKVTASVYVKHNGVLDDPNSHLTTKIRRLVASSVPGLNYDDVTVIPDRARMSETTPESQSSATEEPQDYVQIWSIVLAKSSEGRFRAIFFSFSLLVLILVLILIWFGWKFHHVLHQAGGIKQLLNIHPIVIEPKTAEEAEVASAEEAEKKIEEADKIVAGEDTPDEDISDTEKKK